MTRTKCRSGGQPLVLTCATLGYPVNAVGLRELRQRASELVRRVEAGDVVTVTVSGRAAAQLVPVTARQVWRSFDDIADLFAGPPDPAWEADRATMDDRLHEPSL